MSSEPIESLLAVIVVFGMSPTESRSFISMLEAIRQIPERKLRVGILVYDNSPNPIAPGELPEYVQYLAPRMNGGVSAACNYALEVAESSGFDWLLTLDQEHDIT